VCFVLINNYSVNYGDIGNIRPFIILHAQDNSLELKIPFCLGWLNVLEGD
jgi:hypothetical protein